MIYQKKRGSYLRGDAQVIGEELEEIRVRNGGILTASIVVAAATVTDSPLHPEFEWNDMIAARKFREEQARAVIRSIVVIDPVRDGEEREAAVPAFVQLRVKMIDDDEREEERSAYLSIRTILEDEGLRSQMLRDARNELRSFERKYALLRELDEELRGVLDAIATLAA